MEEGCLMAMVVDAVWWLWLFLEGSNSYDEVRRCE